MPAFQAPPEHQSGLLLVVLCGRGYQSAVVDLATQGGIRQLCDPTATLMTKASFELGYARNPLGLDRRQLNSSS